MTVTNGSTLLLWLDDRFGRDDLLIYLNLTDGSIQTVGTKTSAVTLHRKYRRDLHTPAMISACGDITNKQLRASWTRTACVLMRTTLIVLGIHSNLCAVDAWKLDLVAGKSW